MSRHNLSARIALGVFLAACLLDVLFLIICVADAASHGGSLR